MAFTHQKTVTVDPITDAYSWSIVDTATNSAPTWVVITNAQDSNGNDTDTWDFYVETNTAAPRQAIATVTHSQGPTDSFTIDQAGTTPAPPVGVYSTLVGAPNPVNEGASVTFTVSGNNLEDGTVPYTLSGAGLTAGDIGIGLTGTISIVGATNSGTLTVPITSDNLTEGSESILCTLGSTDSNGVSTGSLTTSVAINDTSLTPDTQVTINLNEGSTTWMINNSSLVSGNVNNESFSAVSASFDAQPGEVVRWECTASATTGYDFTQVGANPVVSLSNGTQVNVTKISEDLNYNWPNMLKFVLETTVGNNNSTSTLTINATTLAESTTRQIALHGPLSGNWTCLETTVDIVAAYDDANGTTNSPQPAVGVSLPGVLPNNLGSFLVVAGSGSNATTGTAVNLIGQTIGILEEEIMGINNCNPNLPISPTGPTGPTGPVGPIGFTPSPSG